MMPDPSTAPCSLAVGKSHEGDVLHLDLDHVAHLARLDLSEAERASLGPQLLQIIDYIAQLQQLETESIEATFQVVAASSVMREDAVTTSLSREEALANAPQSENGCFRVPRIL